MNRPTLDLNPAYERCSPARNWILFNVLSPLFRSSKVRRPPVNLTVNSQNEPRIGAAEPGRVFHERPEHRLEIEGRTADDFQHLASRRLLFQRFAQVAVARFELLEQ